MAFTLYKNYFTKAAKRCKDLPGKEKALCMLKAKAAAKEAQLNALKKASQKCMKTKDPKKCKQKFNAKMSKVGGEQGYLKSTMLPLSKQKYAQ
jgi:phenylalanyl-tRNA synthetase alpha subunit